VLATTLAVPSSARAKAARHSIAAVDPDYISALTTANRFLQAWQAHDQETGLLLLSDAAKRQTSADNLEAFFSSRQSAYEITHGRKMDANRYSFSVVLFQVQEGARARHCYSELVVRRTGKKDWAIDTLPRP
jgi:hypothetical protein